MIQNILHKIKGKFDAFKYIAPKNSHELENYHEDAKDYWTQHNITLHHQFASQEESLEYFHWRNDQYYKYIQLMPVAGYDGKAILDYGCGPGHDLVGFGAFSSPSRLVGADLSASSLGEAKDRLALHGIAAELAPISPDKHTLPFDDASIDHIHCSGVLHHTPDPLRILREFKRILRPRGTANIMVYHYHSLWVHLYVAYVRSIEQGLFPELPLLEQFARSTDGEDCPISTCYTVDQWIAICSQAGLEATFTGAAVSVHEASLLQKRFSAIQDRRMPPESRRFLAELEFDAGGLPLYKGIHAGIDACFAIRN
ncbi:MAG: class I SAM-dependent methyltransferase [Desulfovibrionaceae bacterium]|nr:class I SAM-dependent methyltransferase [Desulfovibrionaceae bacterium]